MELEKSKIQSSIQKGKLGKMNSENIMRGISSINSPHHSKKPSNNQVALKQPNSLHYQEENSVLQNRSINNHRKPLRTQENRYSENEKSRVRIKNHSQQDNQNLEKLKTTSNKKEKVEL